MAENNQNLSLQQIKLSKTNSDIGTKKSIIQTNISDINNILNENTPADEIIQFIEKSEFSEKMISMILNKILQSHRTMSDKIDIITTILK